MTRFVDFVFDGPPGPVSGRFVEVEDEKGRSVQVGEWVDSGDGFWRLRVHGIGPLVEETGRELERLRADNAQLTMQRDAYEEAHRAAHNKVNELLTVPSARAEVVARMFHEAYERLAPEHGYKTREASAVPWDRVPADNRALMVATAGEVLARLRSAGDGAAG